MSLLPLVCVPHCFHALASLCVSCRDSSSRELALSAIDDTSGETVTLELSSMPAGHAVLHGTPKGFEVHADEFWCVLRPLRKCLRSHAAAFAAPSVMYGQRIPYSI